VSYGSAMCVCYVLCVLCVCVLCVLCVCFVFCVLCCFVYVLIMCFMCYVLECFFVLICVIRYLCYVLFVLFCVICVDLCRVCDVCVYSRFVLYFSPIIWSRISSFHIVLDQSINLSWFFSGNYNTVMERIWISILEILKVL